MNSTLSKSIAAKPMVCSSRVARGVWALGWPNSIENGFRKVVTARDPSKLEGYGATYNLLMLKLDAPLTDEAAAAVQAAEARIDV